MLMLMNNFLLMDIEGQHIHSVRVAHFTVFPKMFTFCIRVVCSNDISVFPAM